MKQNRKAEAGQGLVEYLCIIVLVAIVLIAMIAILGPQLSNVFSSLTNLSLGG